MYTLGNDVRDRIRRYAMGRIQGLDTRSTKDLLAELQALDPTAASVLVHEMLQSWANAPTDSTRTAYIAECRRRDGVDTDVFLGDGIPGVRRTFAEFRGRADYPAVGDALTAVQLWAKGMQPKLLTLSGPPGTGKTHLAIAAAQALLDQGAFVLYRDEPALIAELQAHIPKGDLEKVTNEFATMPWLVLDDLGTAALGDWGRALIDRLINIRWEGREWLHTLITTNLTSESMPGRIGSRLGDTQRARVVVIRAPDYRRHPDG